MSIAMRNICMIRGVKCVTRYQRERRSRIDREKGRHRTLYLCNILTKSNQVEMSYQNVTVHAGSETLTIHPHSDKPPAVKINDIV